ncbi:MAG: trigger factor, partial [Gammaproteobacteria bacterium]|nr:trigger factor [Gammaproteobacteria bacterium]
DGFRPGKVPLKVLARNYGDRVRHEVVSETLQSSFNEAVTQEKLNLAGSPNIQSVESESGKGVSYTAVFEIVPEITVTDFGALKFKRYNGEVGPDDVDKMMETLRKQRRTWSDKDGDAASGDRLTIDFNGTIDGEEFEGGKGQQVPLELGSGAMIAGFEDGLIGAKAGDERNLELTFPDEYHSKDVAGKPVLFSVTVHKVEEAMLPDIDESFIKEFGVKEGGIEAFRQEITTNMKREMGDAIQARIKKEVLDGVLEANPVDLPQTMVKEEANQLLKHTKDNMVQRGVASSKLDLSVSLFEEQAQRRVALGLVMADVIKTNNIRVDSDKVRQRVEGIASSYQEPDQVVRWYYGEKDRLADIESVVLEDQVVEWVLDKAEVSEEQVTFDA